MTTLVPLHTILKKFHDAENGHHSFSFFLSKQHLKWLFCSSKFLRVWQHCTYCNYFSWSITTSTSYILELVKMKFTQSCPTLCDTMNYTVHGILQARILEWVAFPFYSGSSQLRDQTHVSHNAGKFLSAEPQGLLFKTICWEWIIYYSLLFLGHITDKKQ